MEEARSGAPVAVISEATESGFGAAEDPIGKLSSHDTGYSSGGRDLFLAASRTVSSR